MRSIALFGGTFDPIHLGHIHTSLNIQKNFHFDAYKFLPCKATALKSASIANPMQRVDMLKIALAPYSQFELDLREINREPPSYMVDTLMSLRQESPDDSITLIIGFDAFLSLPKWHEWEKIIKLANLLIINRNTSANAPISKSLSQLLIHHQSKHPKALLEKKLGVIYLFNAGDYPISSTQIRDALIRHETNSASLPPGVLEYIKQKGLYQ